MLDGNKLFVDYGSGSLIHVERGRERDFMTPNLFVHTILGAFSKSCKLILRRTGVRHACESITKRRLTMASVSNFVPEIQSV